MSSENKDQRSRIMRQVKSKNTGPEMVVRKMVHSMGYRYRLHRKDLPCQPDLTFPSMRKVIFVHGCFWHGHDCKRGARMPSTNIEYWEKKIARNVERDAECCDKLNSLGWQVLIIWECELKDLDTVARKIAEFLD